MKIKFNNLIVNFYNKALALNKANRPLQDLILLYTLLALLFFTGVSIWINIYQDNSPAVTIFNYASFGILVVLYGLARNIKLVKVVKWVFIVLVAFAMSLAWVFTDGSAGPAIIFVHGFISLLVFMLIGKELYFTLGFMIVLAVSLYIFEYFFPDVFHHYSSQKQRTLDSLSVALIILLLEIPILLFARNALYTQRNKAIHDADVKASIMANLSHEIRTPMNAILGFTDLMTDDLIGEKERFKYLSIVKQNSRSLMNLLDNVISAAKLDEGTAKVYYSKNNANEILHYASETLKALTISPKVNLKLELLEDKKSQFYVDENLLFQILINLGYNSIKFTKEGEIVFRANIEGDSIIFSVSDTGTGTPEEKKEDLFERFLQLNNHIKMTPTNGAGLGLSISKRLTELLQGEIWFKSKENVGTQFFVKLPLAPGLK